MIYFCAQKNRRSLVLEHATLNGIDYLEVCTSGEDSACGKQLMLFLLKPATNVTLGPQQVRITGGASSTAQITVASVTPPTAQNPNLFVINLDESGDFSTYTLALIAVPDTWQPPPNIDPVLSRVSFSFKAGCPSNSDCLPTNCCPPDVIAPPDINYLARDYDSFRQTMLDRLAVLVPGWDESHVPDNGIALLEAMAYAADHVSYQQDAIGTEAYLRTARSRISARRHARLVDYTVNEGSNARAWLYFRTLQDDVLVPQGTAVYPLVPGLPPVIAPNPPSATLNLLQAPGLEFLTLLSSTLWLEQNKICFYTWSDTNCCVPPGAVEATFKGTLTSLAAGSYLIFEEVKGPDTGEPGDANPDNRWAVRLTDVNYLSYTGDDVLRDPLTNHPITYVRWGTADALPFPLCVSSTASGQNPPQQLTDVSVAHGNVIPADHGSWVYGEQLPVVGPPPIPPVTASSCSCGTQSVIDTPIPRYFPRLAQSPLTFAPAFQPAAPASQLAETTQPAYATISLNDGANNLWLPQTDLLSSTSEQTNFVPEIDSSGNTFLRFGDGQYGAAADEGETFIASYRVGNGNVGNVGRDTLVHVIAQPTQIAQVRNPLAAAGGVDGETLQHIQQTAPFAFNTQLRCVTEDDYGDQAELIAGVEAARGTFRWTGSWYTAFVSVEADGGNEPAAALVTAVKQDLNLLRMAGTDLQVEGAVIVGLDIAFEICVDADHFQSDVRDALLQLFISGNQCSGQPGLLAPANFTFGETIYLSPLIAAAQGVEGVVAVTPLKFRRLDASGVDNPLIDGVAQGYLTMGRLEIAHCDNNPNRLDLGQFSLTMDGGK
jgi:Baseplate J-like protein